MGLGVSAAATSGSAFNIRHYQLSGWGNAGLAAGLAGWATSGWAMPAAATSGVGNIGFGSTGSNNLGIGLMGTARLGSAANSGAGNIRCSTPAPATSGCSTPEAGNFRLFNSGLQHRHWQWRNGQYWFSMPVISIPVTLGRTTRAASMWVTPTPVVQPNACYRLAQHRQRQHRRRQFGQCRHRPACPGNFSSGILWRGSSREPVRPERRHHDSPDPLDFQSASIIIPDT